MAKLKFAHRNWLGFIQTRSPYNFLTKYTTPSLTYYKDNVTRYIPLITKTGYVDIDNYRYSYTNTDRTIHCYYNNTEYVVPNKQEALITYDIPAGTYTPSDFETLIKQFISNNRNRMVENAFQVNVNGQTVSVPANSYIYYTVNSSSPQGYVRAVWFNPSSAPGSGAAPEIAYCQGGTGFTFGHCYVVYIKTGSGYSYVGNFAGYARYNINVDTGIKFR